MSDDDSVTMISLDDVMMISSEGTMADEGDKSRVGELGEGSRGSRGEGVRINSCSDAVEEMGVADDSTAEGLKGRTVKIGEGESVGTTESLSVTIDDVTAS